MRILFLFFFFFSAGFSFVQVAFFSSLPVRFVYMRFLSFPFPPAPLRGEVRIDITLTAWRSVYVSSPSI